MDRVDRVGVSSPVYGVVPGAEVEAGLGAGVLPIFVFSEFGRRGGGVRCH